MICGREDTPISGIPLCLRCLLILVILILVVVYVIYRREKKKKEQRAQELAKEILKDFIFYYGNNSVKYYDSASIDANTGNLSTADPS